MPLLRNVLIFHSGALGDLVLSFPLALALARLHPTSRVRYVTTAGKGRLAQRVLGVESADAESGFSSLFAEGAEVPQLVANMLAGSHRIVSFVAGRESVWARRVSELAPQAMTLFATTTPTRPGAWAIDHLREQCASEKAMGGAVDQILSLIVKQGLVRGAEGGRGVVVHPGAGSPGKCWPLDRFRELAIRLKEAGTDVRWVLGEVELERMPSAERRALDVLGDVIVPHTYEGLLEELTSAAVFVGNDSGPGHLAAIAGVPTVSLFGPTSPEVWRPLGPRVETIWGRGEMEGVEVEAVLGAVQKMMVVPSGV